MARRICAGVAFLGLLLTCVTLAANPERASVTVFAAASLSEAVQELATAYQRDTGIPVKVSFASSGTLARQIDAGAEVDVFISADLAWMDTLERHQRLVAGSRRPLLHNRLVLIAPAGSSTQLKLGPNVPILAALGGGRLAVAEPETVPAGRYAQAALTSFGVWQDLEPHLVRAEDVRVALAWVARGEAPLGVVYATDARVESRVRVVDTFPASSYPPIVYPVALIAGASRPAAGFVAYLESQAGRTVFARYGFTNP